VTNEPSLETEGAVQTEEITGIEVDSQDGSGGPQINRILHVPISQQSWKRARLAALDSRMSLKAYVDRLLETAKPIQGRGSMLNHSTQSTQTKEA